MFSSSALEKRYYILLSRHGELEPRNMSGVGRMIRKRRREFRGWGREKGGGERLRRHEQASSEPRSRTQLVRIHDDSPLLTSCRTCTNRERILARHREYTGGGPEDSIGVNQVKWATPSGPRRRRRLQSLRRRQTGPERDRDRVPQNVGRAVRWAC